MEGGWFPAPTRPQAELSFETTALLDDFQALGYFQQFSQGELPVSDEPTLRLLLRRSSLRHSPASSNRPSSIHTSLAGSRADRGRRDMYLGRTGFGGVCSRRDTIGGSWTSAKAVGTSRWWKRPCRAISGSCPGWGSNA